MTVKNTSLQNFASGELSPKMRGRFDLPLYYNGCEIMRNFIAETQGPAKFRTGVRYVNHTRLNKVAILIPFQFNDEQSYILEFTDLFMRVFRNEGFITNTANTITGITQANPAVVTSTAHTLSNGDEVFIEDVVGMTEVNGKTFLVANKAANTFELTDIDANNIDSTGFTAYASGGTAASIFEVATPYTEAQLFELKFDQNADIMYMVHPLHEPRKITRTDHNAWTVATYVRTNDPFPSAGNFPSGVGFYEGRLGFGGTNNNPEKFELSRSPDTTTGAPRHDDFTTGVNPDDAVSFTLSPQNGKVEKIQWLAGTDKFLAMGTFGGVTKVTGSPDDQAIAPSSILARSVDSFGCANIMPIRQGNLIIYVQQGKLTIRSFEFDVLADGFLSVDRNLVSDHITESGINQIAYQTGRPDILWCVRGDGVLVGVTFKSREDVSGWHRQIPAGTNAKFLSVGNMPIPTANDQTWTVVERTINSVTRRHIEFFEDEPIIPRIEDFFTGKNNEITDTTTWRNAMFEAQKGYVHVDSALSYDGTDPGTDASAAVTPAAVSGTGITFTASAAVFSAADVGREIWKKAIKGVGTGRAVITAFVSSTNVTCNIIVDFDNTGAMAAGNWYLTTDTVSGIDHLEGESVAIVTDGGEHPNKTVVSGAVTLDYQSSRVHVGLGYTGFIKTMKLEAGGTIGPSQTKAQNINRIGIRFLDTLGAQYGTGVYRLQDVVFRSSADLLNRPPPLFSGDIQEFYEDITEQSKHVFIAQRKPLPCIVQMIVPYVDTDND